MKKLLVILMLCLLPAPGVRAGGSVERVLFIGDSMTGWLAERFEAYGERNGFSASTVVWDGSTLTKWVNSNKIPQFIDTYKPDVVFICLGMNDMLATDPERRMAAPLAKLKSQLGPTPFVWIGPPTWPGRSNGAGFNEWMEKNIRGNGHYFRSQEEKLARQSAKNPHPTRAACARWMDAVVKWLPTTSLPFPRDMSTPPPSEMKKGKNYIYRRMKQPL